MKHKNEYGQVGEILNDLHIQFWSYYSDIWYNFLSSLPTLLIPLLSLYSTLNYTSNFKS